VGLINVLLTVMSAGLVWCFGRLRAARDQAESDSWKRRLGWGLLIEAMLLAGVGGIRMAGVAAVAGGFSLLLGYRHLRLPWFTGAARPTVVTDHLDLELGADGVPVRGRVLKGVFAGRRLERLAPAELALLWQDCRYTDQSSARLVEAWLDRMHPTWREDLSRAEASTGPGGRMTRKEALEVLGLKAGASEEDIRRAHRELIKRMHPDAGGSGYLAAKINEAKDLLLRG
jgi:hypothetical protein